MNKWIKTKEINELKFSNVLIGEKYSYILDSKSEVGNFKLSTFRGIKILESLILNNTIYILIKVESIQEFKNLKCRMIVDSENYEHDDSNYCKITAILNNEILEFNTTIN